MASTLRAAPVKPPPVPAARSGARTAERTDLNPKGGVPSVTLPRRDNASGVSCTPIKAPLHLVRPHLSWRAYSSPTCVSTSLPRYPARIRIPRVRQRSIPETRRTAAEPREPGRLHTTSTAKPNLRERKVRRFSQARSGVRWCSDVEAAGRRTPEANAALPFEPTARRVHQPKHEV